MDPKHLVASVVGSKFVPVFTCFAEQVDPPNDFFDSFADLLWPPRYGSDAPPGQSAESCNLPRPIAGECASHIRHGDSPGTQWAFERPIETACTRDPAKDLLAVRIQLRQRFEVASAGACLPSAPSIARRLRDATEARNRFSHLLIMRSKLPDCGSPRAPRLSTAALRT